MSLDYCDRKSQWHKCKLKTFEINEMKFCVRNKAKKRRTKQRVKWIKLERIIHTVQLQIENIAQARRLKYENKLNKQQGWHINDDMHLRAAYFPWNSTISLLYQRRDMKPMRRKMFLYTTIICQQADTFKNV